MNASWRPLTAVGRARFAAAGLAVAAWLGVAAPATAGGDLFIYNWTDYTAPALIQKFQKETGVTVRVDTYDTNETLLAKLTSGTSGYDIVVASSDFVPIFTAQGLVQKIDGPSLEGYGNIDKRWQSPAWDKGNAYTIPFHWGVTSFVVNTKVVKGPVDSLATLFVPPPEARGKVGMFSAPTEVVSLAELYLGLAPCQTDVAAIKRVDDLLQSQRRDVVVYDSQGTIDREVSGDTVIAQMTNGVAAGARANDPAIRFVFPKEGVVGWMDNLAIPRGASHPENAKLFLEFMLKPENSALSANFTHYASALAGAEAFYAPSLRDAPELQVPAQTKIVFSPACSAPAIKLIDRVWTRLRR